MIGSARHICEAVESEDSDIHCLRSSSLAEEAAREITQHTGSLRLAIEEDNNEDPSADLIQDTEELEMKEVVVNEELED